MNEALLYWGLALLAAGLLLVVLEAFVPSAGILGIVSAALSIAGIVALWRYETVWGIIGLAVTIVVGPAAFFWALSVLPSTPMGKQLFGAEADRAEEERELAEREAESVRASLIGAEGVAVTPLRPVGEIEVDGRRVEALAEFGAIERGERVVIVRAEGFEIKVRRAEA